MADESLLTPEVMAQIGQRTEPVRIRVTGRMVGRARDLHHAAGRRRLSPGDPVPGIVMTVLDGEGERLSPAIPLPDDLLVSNEWSLDRPLRLDEEVVLTASVVAISERLGGRFGHSVNSVAEIEVADAEGRRIGHYRRTLMHYNAANAREPVE